MVRRVNRTASYQREHTPLVIPLVLVVQFKPSCVSFSKIDYKCLPGAQQYQKDLADKYLALRSGNQLKVRPTNS